MNAVCLPQLASRPELTRTSCSQIGAAGAFGLYAGICLVSRAD